MLYEKAQSLSLLYLHIFVFVIFNGCYLSSKVTDMQS